MKEFTEEQLKKIEILKSSDQYPEILNKYGELIDSDLLALVVMNEVQIGLAELANEVENSEVKKYVDRIEQEKNKDQTGI